jgi:hypothetical protein
MPAWQSARWQPLEAPAQSAARKWHHSDSLTLFLLAEETK